MEAKKNKRGLKPGTTNNPNGRAAIYGERVKKTIRLPKALMENIELITDNTTDFIINALYEAYEKQKQSR